MTPLVLSRTQARSRQPKFGCQRAPQSRLVDTQPWVGNPRPRPLKGSGALEATRALKAQTHAVKWYLGWQTPDFTRFIAEHCADATCQACALVENPGSGDPNLRLVMKGPLRFVWHPSTKPLLGDLKPRPWKSPRNPKEPKPNS